MPNAAHSDIDEPDPSAAPVAPAAAPTAAADSGACTTCAHPLAYAGPPLATTTPFNVLKSGAIGLAAVR